MNNEYDEKEDSIILSHGQNNILHRKKNKLRNYFKNTIKYFCFYVT